MATDRKRILVIDDDTRLRNLLGHFLTESNFNVELAGDTAIARQILTKDNFDLLIVDVMMKGENGIEFTKSYRHENDTPILILTARGESSDRIEGLRSGAQDYLSKPFEPQELLLRINNILRYSAGLNPRESTSLCKFGDFVFNFDKHSLQKNNQFIHLTDSEKNILNILCKNQNQILSRDDLAKQCNVDLRSIDVQITRLRKKIEKNPKKPEFLQTIRGKGYALRD